MNEEQWLDELQELLSDAPAEEPPKQKDTAPVKKEEKNAKEKKPAARQKKIVLAGAGVLAAALIAGAAWTLLNFYIVDFKLYAKDAAALDLRDREISVSHYDKVAQKLPDCEIRWDVPFQGGVLADDTTEVTVTSLTAEDVKALAHLSQLKTVHAESCTDYDQLMTLKETCPKVKVTYTVTLGGEAYDGDSAKIDVSSIASGEIEQLQYFRNLTTVVAHGGKGQDFSELRQYCRNREITFCVSLGGTEVPADETAVTVEGITDDDLEVLGCLENLKKLHLVDPTASAESILALPDGYPQAEVSWEVTICGETFTSTDTPEEIDLSDAEITSLEAVETAMAYLPDAQKLILGVCGVDNPDWGNSKSKLAASEIENEDLAAYRDRVREDYKVVWTVRLGPSIALRTDADNFMPNHFGVGQLPDSYAYNLRYCEDMVCLDVGHMTLTDISFVEYMPNLKYLILAWTEVQYIAPIRTWKNLIWLELDNSCIRDYSPLVDCTALEDLNIGRTSCDITPILEMAWLKNLYMIFGNGGYAWRASQALPNTHVVATGDATVGGGWRRLPNYYDMRDCLGMYYMN